MIKTMFAAAALTGLVLSTAATAASAKDRVIANAPTPDVTASADAPKAEPKYCIIDTPTGSHITKKVCKTRNEWKKQDGFDPLNQ